MRDRHRAFPESHRKERTGSPAPGEPVYLAVGKLRRPHGIKGEILMDVLTDFPERLKPGEAVYVGEEHQLLTLRSLRTNDQTLLVSFENIDDSDAAGTLRNTIVWVRSDRLPSLPEGEYYFHQLIGLQVVREDGQAIGKLVEIIETGANDVYLVRAEDGVETLIPAIPEVIVEVDLQRHLLRINPPIWE
jgi:16S rRNA processing protein RimM